MQVELPLFRHQVPELEFKLKRLKLQRGSPVAGTGKSKLPSPRSLQNLVEKGSERTKIPSGTTPAQAATARGAAAAASTQADARGAARSVGGTAQTADEMGRAPGHKRATTSTWDHFVICD
ncbi:hypothetical protein PF005_g10051 [Phytophthora fragariae]|uniref:Uncharacterized protein n=1 Tax=Phytophthora fragariae TaxID=53985 RepID=A0A6A3Y820_9STRA|nr:hypothetical protein PF003_g20255 [Phytophthora fragariae]KAE8939000.1 hypothetical protein PF009_g11139 [Phytophthora fragariae]KAE9012651.1 hypothetical protein PF011_g8824 [Phytophthora fragariae]KAE9115043.1 hypothetical protein PF007_g10159 [Phytophthora fragariae]KAE9115324.1 hypothetical protein PF010_g9370 [Phytophthora fragariae]